MRYYLIVLTELLVGCYHPKHIKKGTTILAALTPNSIILFADSRSEFVTGDFSYKRYIDTTNKIHKMGKYFYEIAGTSHFREASLDDIIELTFNPALPLKQNSDKIDSVIFNTLNSYYSNLDKSELSYYNQSIPKFGMLQIFIAGYEKTDDETPSFTQLEFKITNRITSYEVTKGNSFSIKFNKGNTALIDGGYHAQIDKVLSSGYNTKYLSIQQLKYLISLEADCSKNVGYGYNYVIIKKDSYILGKSY